MIACVVVQRYICAAIRANIYISYICLFWTTPFDFQVNAVVG